ncbi:MAG: hypothetical protein IJ518_03330 [Clostridia bacterium]|nr:hypothetical protein [Clostridia bacterium]
MSKKMLVKWLRLTAVCLVLTMCLSVAVSAGVLEELTYTYNSYADAVPVPDLFRAVKFVGGESMECGSFSKPAEMYMHTDGNLYICDTDNNRIVVLDRDLNFVRILEEFYYPETDETIYLYEPSGIYVDDQERLYISNTQDCSILRCDQEGVIDRMYFTPEISQFNDEVYFEPTRLLVDQQDNLYVLCRNIYQGIVMFNADGEFETFYGAESVFASAEVRMQQLWKNILSDEAKEGTAQYVPTEMKCIDIDSEGYIYTIAQAHSTLGTKNQMDSIRKLNAKGADILVKKMPKLSFTAFQGAAVHLNMTDVVVDEDGYITIIDAAKGKLLHFDREMNLLGMSGCIGYDLGQYQVPSAIEQNGDRVYVLDQSTNMITMLELTEFGQAVHTAVSAYQEGYYDQTVGPWNEVISLSANYEFAYTCLGNAYLNSGEYQKALECYELGRDSEGYNEAYKQIRKDAIRNVLIYVVVAVVAVAVVAIVLVKIVKNRKRR